MKKTLLFSLALGLVLAGCNKSTRSSTASTDTTPSSDQTAVNPTTNQNTAANNVASDMRSAANSASNAIGSAVSSVATTARLTEWKLTSTDIQADLDNNREIIRTKDNAAGAPTGSSDKKVVESMVKGRLDSDSDLAALKLDVDADRHGAVKLSGKAHTAEEVGKAIALALDTEGVIKVTSKIKLDKDAKTNP
jgi:hyperosmotically inducible periplasmic protein